MSRDQTRVVIWGIVYNVVKHSDPPYITKIEQAINRVVPHSTVSVNGNECIVKTGEGTFRFTITH